METCLHWANSIYKKGNENLFTNYRNISILSSIPKILDKISTTKMYDVVRSKIGQEQHRFVKGRSTMNNMLIYNDYIINAFADGMQVDSIYMDFSKAFDSVQYPLLVAKLNNLGVLKWMESYLSGRKQTVRLNGALSEPISVTTGVPQWSHPGTLFFIIFINDNQGRIIFCKILLFSDELKLFCLVHGKRSSFQSWEVLIYHINPVFYGNFFQLHVSLHRSC